MLGAERAGVAAIQRDSEATGRTLAITLSDVTTTWCCVVHPRRSPQLQSRARPAGTQAEWPVEGAQGLSEGGQSLHGHL